MDYDTNDELPERIDADELPALIDTPEHMLAFALPQPEL